MSAGDWPERLDGAQARSRAALDQLAALIREVSCVACDGPLFHEPGCPMVDWKRQ